MLSSYLVSLLFCAVKFLRDVPCKRHVFRWMRLIKLLYERAVKTVLYGVGAGFTRPYSDSLLQRHHKYLAIADLAGVGSLGDGFNDGV